jgi:hypothetical protein
LARFKFKKSAPNSYYNLLRAATPGQITQQKNLAGSEVDTLGPDFQASIWSILLFKATLTTWYKKEKEIQV